MERIWEDVRYGARALARAPSLPLAAAATLALGIGANTTLFTALNALVLRPLPVEGPDELVAIYSSGDRGRTYGTSSYPDLVDWREQSRALAALAAWSDVPLSVSASGEPEHVTGQVVTTNYFEMLGVRAARGRTFRPGEDRVPGGSPVAVLSDRFWRSRFSADEGIVGKSLLLNGRRFIVVGVAPAGFAGVGLGSPPRLWVPMGMVAEVRPRPFDVLTSREARWLKVVGRLRPRAAPAEARDELGAAARRLRDAHPRTNRGYGAVELLPLSQARLRPDQQHSATRVLGLLLGTTGLVALVACANVAGLLLVRASARRREIAIRLSLGATRGRLVRQLLTESVLLAGASVPPALLLAAWGGEILMALRPPELGSLEPDLTLDARVLGFTSGLAVLTALLCGLVPAWLGSGLDPSSALKAEAPAGGSGRSALRSALSTGQMAISLVLLVGAGLFLRSLARAHAIDPGFDPQGVLVASLDLRLQHYEPDRGTRLFETLLERVRALPGVESASLTESVPLSRFGWARRAMHVPGRAAPAGEDPELPTAVVAPDYFRTLGTPVLRGREFTAADRAGAPRVAIVNETLARRYWPGEEAVGKAMRLGTPDESDPAPPLTVVGVVRDGKYRTLGETPQPFLYRPLLQEYDPQLTLIVRSRRDPESLGADVRAAVRTADPDLPVYNVGLMTDAVGTAYFVARALAILLGVFAGLALALALVGLYGVLAYSVAQRTREIGVRMALGADPAAILRHVLRGGMRLALAGSALGLAAAFALTRLARHLLYGLEPTDPLTFAGTTAFLLLAAALACWAPARRAVRVDPAAALRSE